VLDFGEVIGSGTPDQVSKDAKVIEAYIGEDG
jgi:branched-chain amino acid transport system ATP-binding protein